MKPNPTQTADVCPLHLSNRRVQFNVVVNDVQVTSYLSTRV